VKRDGTEENERKRNTCKEKKETKKEGKVKHNKMLNILLKNDSRLSEPPVYLAK
jgi:hypothetical protein